MKTKSVGVSIIIPVRYRADLTEVCINSILTYTQPERDIMSRDYELILVQEGEDKDITKLLTDYVRRFELSDTKRIKYIQNKTPKGYAGALNAGMRVATGEYFCFMNNDTVATPGWMDNMLKAFDDKEVGLVTPTFWGMGTRQSVDWNTKQEFDWVLEPFHLAGVCYLIPRKVMDEIGEWDEQFNHGGEDFDITIRVSNAGYKMIVARKAFIYHYGGASTREYIGNDLVKVRQHHKECIDKLILKHGLAVQDTYERLALKK